MSIHKAVFLDRDGTIIADIPYLNDEKLITISKSAIQGLRLLQALQLKLIIITNQSGIARGFFSKNDLKRIHKNLVELLHREGIEILDVFYCPHHPDDACICRKPSSYMIERAAIKHRIDLKKSFMIGDKLIDVQAGNKAGVKSILLQSNAAESSPIHQPSYVAKNLLDACEWIQQQESVNI